jgi:sortase A
MRILEQNFRCSRFLYWCSLPCIFSGAIALALCMYLWADAQMYQVMQNRRLDSVIAAEVQPARVGSWDSVPTSPTLGSAIGRLEVPRLALSVIVLEGDDPKTLRRGIGRIPGTAKPGEPGNLAIAGHRDTFFRVLRDIRSDDVVRLTTPSGSFLYRVRSVRVVAPTQTEVLGSTPRPTLTLVTCYPFTYVGHAPNRFVVTAEQTSASSQPAANHPPVALEIAPTMNQHFSCFHSRRCQNAVE